MKKTISLVLTVIMVFCLSSTAFAEERYSVHVYDDEIVFSKDSKEAASYDIYSSHIIVTTNPKTNNLIVSFVDEDENTRYISLSKQKKLIFSGEMKSLTVHEDTAKLSIDISRKSKVGKIYVKSKNVTLIVKESAEVSNVYAVNSDKVLGAQTSPIPVTVTI